MSHSSLHSYFLSSDHNIHNDNDNVHIARLDCSFKLFFYMEKIFLIIINIIHLFGLLLLFLIVNSNSNNNNKNINKNNNQDYDYYFNYQYNHLIIESVLTKIGFPIMISERIFQYLIDNIEQYFDYSECEELIFNIISMVCISIDTLFLYGIYQQIYQLINMNILWNLLILSTNIILQLYEYYPHDNQSINDWNDFELANAIYLEIIIIVIIITIYYRYDLKIIILQQPKKQQCRQHKEEQLFSYSF